MAPSRPLILFFEWLTSGGEQLVSGMPDRSLAGELAREGQLMASTFYEGLGQSPLFEVSHFQPGQNLQSACQEADWIFLVAPESENLAIKCCELFQQFESKIISTSQQIIQLTSDKLMLKRRLSAAGVQVPADVAWSVNQPAIVKPRLGTGGIETRLIKPHEVERKLVEQLAAQDWMFEEFVPGTAVSVLVIQGPGDTVFLPATKQLFQPNSFRYAGSQAITERELQSRAQRLARQTIAALPEFKGVVGVDLVLGNTNANRDYVIEINPRLTTSFVPLADWCKGNLGEQMIRVLLGGSGDLEFEFPAEDSASCWRLHSPVPQPSV